MNKNNVYHTTMMKIYYINILKLILYGILSRKVDIFNGVWFFVVLIIKKMNIKQHNEREVAQNKLFY